MTQTWLDFERGWMAGIECPDGWMILAATPTANWWDSYKDEWDQQQEFTGEPPADCYTPQRGLGWAWHIHGLKGRIGYATEPRETTYQGQYIRGDSSWQVTDPGGIWHRLGPISEPPEIPSEPEEPESESEPEPRPVTLQPWYIIHFDRYDPRYTLSLDDIRGIVWGDTMRVELKRPYGDVEALRAVSEYVDYIEDDGRFVIVFSGKWAEYLRGYLLLIGNALPLVNGGP